MPRPRSFTGLPPLVRWVLVVAVVPNAVWLVVVLVGFFTQRVDEMVQVLGYLPVVIVLNAVPGALVGLVLGLLDRALQRRVVDRAGSRGSVALATATTSLPFVGVAVLLAVYLSSWVTVLSSVAIGVVLVLVPIAVCVLRYRRIARGVSGSVYRQKRGDRAGLSSRLTSVRRDASRRVD